MFVCTCGCRNDLAANMTVHGMYVMIDMRDGHIAASNTRFDTLISERAMPILAHDIAGQYVRTYTVHSVSPYDVTQWTHVLTLEMPVR